MMKRVVALVLCLVTLLCCFTACAKDENDKGAYIRMFLSEPIYDFDPLEAFDNADNLQIVSLLFSGLFKADENGNPKKDLVDEYEYIYDKNEDRYYLTMTLNETHWSDGVAVTSNHVRYAFTRLFDASHPATALLYQVKNARAISSGDASIDSLGVIAKETDVVEIEFEGDIDIDAFLQTLCSPALYPIRDDIADYNSDWAKKTSTMVSSGPFLVRMMNYDEKDGFVLERNSYYYRDREKGDDYDKYVTPFRLVCDFTTDVATQLANFDTREKGSLYFLGNIPVAARNAEAFAAILEKGDLTDNASTHVYYLNQNAMIGDKTLFADAKVREALSLALDREAIATALVFAEAADGLVPHTVLNRADKSVEFRKKAEQAIATSPNVEQAKKLLSEAGINASSYSFSITVSELYTDHITAAEFAKKAWEALGFKVELRKLGVTETRIENPVGSGTYEDTGIYENAYKNALKSGDFEVIALDQVATSVDAFGYLAPFAAAFSGNAMTISHSEENGYSYAITPHITGYNSEEYNAKIEAAYAETNQAKRALLLHEAEAMLLTDLPVIPVVYNKDFAVASSKLGKIDASFFCNADFTPTSLSGYWKIALAEGFMNEDEDEEAATEEEAAD